MSRCFAQYLCLLPRDLAEMLVIRCIRCGGEHFVWECEVPPVPDSVQIDQIARISEQSATARFDKVAYQREYMRKRRAAAKADG